MPDLLRQIAVDFWAVFAEMSPYLLFGFFVAGLLSMLVSRKMVERHLGGPGVLPLFKAAIFGVPLPLCSCGVIPVSMSLHKQGASKGATISFLLSTPQTGVDSILVTYSLLGPVFAIFRPLVALVTGVVGGVLVNLFGKPDSAAPAVDPPSDRSADPTWTRRFIDGMEYAFVTLPRDIGKPLLLGLAIAAIISALTPDDFFAEKLGHGLPAMLVMMAVGIPIYVCASASVPVAAALILKGLSPGAALVFLMTGPATNAAGLTTIWNAMGRRTALLYLATVAGCALAAGLLLDALVSRMQIETVSHVHQMIPPTVENLAALVLLALLGYGFYTRYRRRKPA
ncbi:MAG TPA: permease [Sedimentisphaerales bacterium]|nr:permease [Sedimentisphaerales bacterium]HRS10440.1 permease [Sedimentisphaerales bacterium]HRV47145.1 permease [Sedimentisphaerales bacterium]